MAARHHADLVFCRKLAGINAGKLCDKCDGRCPICDSYVRPTALVRICDECNYGSNQGKCIVCSAPGSVDAHYCKECVLLEKDRDGCPRIVNAGSARMDYIYEKKRLNSSTNTLLSMNG